LNRWFREKLEWELEEAEGVAGADRPIVQTRQQAKVASPQPEGLIYTNGEVVRIDASK